MALFDPRQPEVMADPFPALRRLREEEPVHWSPVLRGWLLTRYEDVKAGLFDSRLSADRMKPFFGELDDAERQALSGVERLLVRWAVFNDPPEHTRLRGLMNRAFTPRAIAGLEERIGGVVDRLVTELLAKGDVDLIADFAYTLPATIIAGVLGVPERDVPAFKGWSNDLAAFVGGAQAMADKYPRAARGIAEMDRYFRTLIRERRDQPPREDLIGGLMSAEESGQVLDEDELVATSVLLLFAGHETTTNLLGNGMLALLRHPEALARLRDEPELLPTAIEEMLRYDGPAATLTRTAREDVTIDGVTIAAGQRVFLSLAAANRDPERFADPETFDIARDDNRHLAFGHGPHFCIGAPLARMEARLAFDALLRRARTLELRAEPQWADNLVLRGVRALPLRVR